MYADLILANLLGIGVLAFTGAVFWFARWDNLGNTISLVAGAFVAAICVAGFIWYETVMMRTCASPPLPVDVNGNPVKVVDHGC